MFSVCLAVSRAFVESEVLKCDPEVVMNEAVKYTHYMVRHVLPFLLCTKLYRICLA